MQRDKVVRQKSYVFYFPHYNLDVELWHKTLNSQDTEMFQKVPRIFICFTFFVSHTNFWIVKKRTSIENNEYTSHSQS